ncbi:MAG: hypothetical protein R3190_03170 [Thermoanaerobaculia bacterium]|nr:hypothetical protein [Thermoanaerobaculia bacterium]
MRALAISCALVGVVVTPVTAATPDAGATYYRDVLPILQENCQTCHRPVADNIGGMVAPMSLMTYDEVRPWAKSIAKAVQSRDMPPWFATEHTRGQFFDERVLTEAQIETVVAWAKSGAAAGSPADAPEARSFLQDETSGWTEGEPDLIVSLPEPYFVADDIEDINIDFSTTLTAEQLPEDTWLRGMEFRVGGPNVHHMCASAYPPGESPSIAAGTGKGFQRNGLGCIALGADPTVLPEGFAQLLRAGSTIRFSMHYNKEAGPGTGFSDQSELAFYFAKGPVRHKAVYDAIGNTSFEIPPHQEKWRVGAAKTFEEDAYLLALWPHAHLRAVAARYELFYPDGETELLLDVPEYDQEWQTTYRYREPKLVPAGSRLEVTMWYQNTEERAAERGFNPERAIVFGPETYDEMMLGFLNWAPAEAKDWQLPVEIPSSGSE